MKKIVSIVLISLCLSLMPILASSHEDWDTSAWEFPKEDDTLSYQVDVNVKMLPVFAIDNQDNPIFGLTGEEIMLHVNGKPRKIIYFKRCDFEFSTVEKDKEAPAVNENERVVFIIIDTMFNSTTGFKRSKVIAGDLVKQGKPGDQFVVFENSIFGGLKLVAPPEDSKENIIRKIEKLKKPIEKWASQLFNTRDLMNNVDFSIETEERLETQNWQSLRELHLDSESMRYRHQVEHFCRILSQFKYILKTISSPKLVFLISEGMADGAFKMKLQGKHIAVDPPQPESDAELRKRKFETVLVKEEKNVFRENQVYSSSLFRYLNELIKSINYGGSVLHTINPARPNDTNDAGVSGEMSLKYLANQSGGNYFIGSDTNDIVKRIKKSISAYYEMVFYIEPGMIDSLQVELKCKREGVKLYTTNYTEGGKIYRNMDSLQKKMFALNVVTGGSWSRNSGKVMLIPFQRLKDEKKEKGYMYTLDVPLPNQMKNKRLDIFLIYRDTQTNRVDMSFVTKKVKNWVKIKIKNRSTQNKELEEFFVIIEPENAYCIYNKT